MSKQQIFRAMWVSALVFPLFLLLVFSLGTDWQFPKIWPGIDLKSWLSLSESDVLLHGMVMSLGISTVVAALSTVSAFVVSRYIMSLKSAKNWLLLAYFPFALSPIVYAVCLLFYFNYFNASGTIWGVMLAQFLILFPYGVIVCAGFWNRRIKDLEELTKTMGGNRATRWKEVLWPMGRGILGICFFQSFLISWFDYGMTQFIGVGQVKTLTIHVYVLIGEANPYLAAVAATLLVLPPLIFLAINKRLVFRKEWT